MGCVSPSENFNYAGLRYYNGPYSETHAVKAGDIVIATRDVTQNRAILGSPAIVPAGLSPNGSVAATNLYKVLNNSKTSNDFLYWVLRSPTYRDHIIASAKGTTVLMLTKDAVENYVFPLPPLAEQRAIAHILGTLDEKIDLNRKMSETFEAIMRALLKSWFVDFGPVHAKAEGRDTGLPKHLADLFPNTFEDSKIGRIPAGWNLGKLGDVAQHPRRMVKVPDLNESTPYIALEHMPQHSIALAKWDTADGLASSKFAFKQGEILFGKLRPYFHKVGVAPVDGVCSTDIVVIVPKANEWFGFVLSHLSSEAFVNYTSAGSTGTKMPRTSWTEMSRYSVVLPPSRVAAAFNNLVSVYVSRIIVSIHESRTLASLRDALLPKLISGELRTGGVGESAAGAPYN
jgi:type I restriction enzyme S subunit